MTAGTFHKPAVYDDGFVLIVPQKLSEICLGFAVGLFGIPDLHFRDRKKKLFGAGHMNFFKVLVRHGVYDHNVLT